MDLFPEAFERFKQKVNVNRIKTFNQLELSFSGWAGWKWKGTSRQMDALAVEAQKLRIPVKDYYMREQQKHQWDRAILSAEIEERRFSRSYSSFQRWQSKTPRTTAYQRRISNYLWNHPNATLAEARGHGKRR